MKFKEKKIHGDTVGPIQGIKHVSSKHIKGSHIIRDLYSNIFLCAKKKSGKTSVIFKLLQTCANKNTKIIFFVSTFHKDPSYQAISRYLDNKNISYQAYTSIVEDGVDTIKTLLDDLEKPIEILDNEEDDEDVGDLGIIFPDTITKRKKKRKRKPKKPKKIAPEYILVFDDLSNELKNRNLEKLLCKNRHFKVKVILSSQYLNHLSPQSRKQVDVWILFKSHPLKKLKEIHKDADICLELDNFVQLYKHATKKPYSFLYIDCRHDDFRRNFNVRLDVSKNIM